MVNYLTIFCTEIAKKTQSLLGLLHSDANCYWDPEHNTAYEDDKPDLSATPALAYYVPPPPPVNLTLSNDACFYGLGAVPLQEGRSGTRLPVAYISRVLTGIRGIRTD